MGSEVKTSHAKRKDWFYHEEGKARRRLAGKADQSVLL
jgi:hypothetical protein